MIYYDSNCNNIARTLLTPRYVTVFIKNNPINGQLIENYLDY